MWMVLNFIDVNKQRSGVTHFEKIWGLRASEDSDALRASFTGVGEVFSVAAFCLNVPGRQVVGVPVYPPAWTVLLSIEAALHRKKLHAAYEKNRASGKADAKLSRCTVFL